VGFFLLFHTAPAFLTAQIMLLYSHSWSWHFDTCTHRFHLLTGDDSNAWGFF